MAEFKGTKGKWCVDKSGYITANGGLCIMVGNDCISVVGDGNPHQPIHANALLISKAPEMLDRIEQMNIDLKILLHNMMREEKINHRVEGYPKVIQQWIEANEQLIKEATELK